MSGSALPPFRLLMSRGCKVHLNVRPADLLPSLSRAFDTPLGRWDLSPRLGPATGRSGAYPDGTFTR